jgi:hypothetical protein
MDERLLKLSQYIKDTIADSGLKLHPFHKRYAYDSKGNAIMGQSTFRGIVNDPKSFPDKTTFDRLSIVLSKAKGYEVPASYLMGLCDLEQSEYDAIEDGSEPVDGSSVRADQLVRQYQTLPYLERQRIAAELLRTIANDEEYTSASDTQKIAFLVRRERDRSGVGLDRFAEKHLGLPTEIVRAIAEGTPVKINKSQLLSLVSCIRDIDDKLSLNEDDARRSLFAKVLAPNLFIK